MILINIIDLYSLIQARSCSRGSTSHLATRLPSLYEQVNIRDRCKVIRRALSRPWVDCDLSYRWFF